MNAAADCRDNNASREGGIKCFRASLEIGDGPQKMPTPDREWLIAELTGKADNPGKDSNNC